jgi:hypothetical protein
MRDSTTITRRLRSIGNQTNPRTRKTGYAISWYGRLHSSFTYTTLDGLREREREREFVFDQEASFAVSWSSPIQRNIHIGSSVSIRSTIIGSNNTNGGDRGTIHRPRRRRKLKLCLKAAALLWIVAMMIAAAGIYYSHYYLYYFPPHGGFDTSSNKDEMSYDARKQAAIIQDNIVFSKGKPQGDLMLLDNNNNNHKSSDLPKNNGQPIRVSLKKTDALGVHNTHKKEEDPRVDNGKTALVVQNIILNP